LSAGGFALDATGTAYSALSGGGTPGKGKEGRARERMERQGNREGRESRYAQIKSWQAGTVYIKIDKFVFKLDQYSLRVNNYTGFCVDAVDLSR